MIPLRFRLVSKIPHLLRDFELRVFGLIALVNGELSSNQNVVIFFEYFDVFG